MAGKGRKAAQQVEEEEVDNSESSIDMKTLVRLLMEGNEKTEARRIAEEERAEARRIAAEERAEARRLAEVEAKERAALRASEKLLEQQEAIAAKQYEQQVALMRMQAEIGERAATAYREEQAVSRKRDRAVASIPSYREGEDVEEFLLTAERRLSAGEIPEKDWLTTLTSKLSGKTGSMWQDLRATCDDYQEVKTRLLKVCGYTAKLAAEVFFGFRFKHVKGMTADQLYHRGVQLLRRVVAPHKIGEEAEFAILKGWVSSVIPKKGRMILDARAVMSVTELIDALQDYLMMEGDRTEGQAAVFKKQAHSSEGSGDRKGSSSNCFKCGKVGHKAFECWQGKGSSNSFGSSKPVASASSAPTKIICYTCGECSCTPACC